MTRYPGMAWVGVEEHDTGNDSTSSSENTYFVQEFNLAGVSSRSNSNASPCPFRVLESFFLYVI